jgi:hypothetical protein
MFTKKYAVITTSRINLHFLLLRYHYGCPSRSSIHRWKIQRLILYFTSSPTYYVSTLHPLFQSSLSRDWNSKKRSQVLAVYSNHNFKLSVKLTKDSPKHEVYIYEQAGEHLPLSETDTTKTWRSGAGSKRSTWPEAVHRSSKEVVDACSREPYPE